MTKNSLFQFGVLHTHARTHNISTFFGWHQLKKVSVSQAYTNQTSMNFYTFLQKKLFCENFDKLLPMSSTALTSPVQNCLSFTLAGGTSQADGGARWWTGEGRMVMLVKVGFGRRCSPHATIISVVCGHGVKGSGMQRSTHLSTTGCPHLHRFHKAK